MQSYGNIPSSDGYVSNIQLNGGGANPPPPVRAPSPGRPNVFQKTWEDYHNGNHSQANFPVTLKMGDIIEGYRTILRELPDLDDLVGAGGFNNNNNNKNNGYRRRPYDDDEEEDDFRRDYEEDYDDDDDETNQSDYGDGSDDYDIEDP
jgi:hypothetical protein